MPPPEDCANPLFLKWLEELRDAAREKGLKVADVYHKGCRAIAACPIAYTRPAALAPLQGIGPKTIQLLEAKLKAHCKATGEAYPESPPRQVAAKRPKAKEKEVEDDDAPAPKKKAKRPPRPYIPAARSGPAGILIGMVVAAGDEPDEALVDQLTRGEIVRHAQPFCDASYDHSERGTWVTAWNGMKTLVNKGYVGVQGIPHRYTLTEAGFDVAVVLRNMQDEFKDGPQIVPFVQRADKDEVWDRPLVGAGPGPSTIAARQSHSAAPTPPADHAPVRSAPPASRRVSASRFGFWYLDTKGNRVEDLLAARTRLDPVDFVTLRQIEFLDSQRDHPITGQLRLVDDDPTLHDDGLVTLGAYFVEDEAPPQCSKFDDDEIATKVQPPPVQVASTSRAVSVGPSRRLARTASSRPRLSSQMPLPGEHRDADFDPADTIIFPKGSYEILLVIDTREVESRANRDRITESLERKGVRVETRALRLGDMCWVARRLDAYGAEEDECVLDFVVERKRLDDLVASIRDGRYNEQCFRLGQSGIRNVFYIVEDYQKAQRMQFQGKQIMTAKSQVQVMNGFFLKETHKLADTIDYLVAMTSVIKASAGDLHIIPSRYLSRTNYSSLQTKLRASHPNNPFLTSYEAFQELNKKSNLRTTKEYLARMLLVIKGMSPERVSAMLDVWETPRELYDAMKVRHAQGVLEDGRRKRGPEFMFADVVPGEGRRKIGDALSKAIWYALWGKDNEDDVTPAKEVPIPAAKKGAQATAKKTTPAVVPSKSPTPTKAVSPPPPRRPSPPVPSPTSSPEFVFAGWGTGQQPSAPAHTPRATMRIFVPPPFPVSPARSPTSPSSRRHHSSPSRVRRLNINRSRVPLFLDSDSDDTPETIVID
ncbi:hypothetical protein CcaverHIS002_0208730 [Cutaneotrichosporon cavernicola]|uniref:Crossover junction endonuclease MUS81 n=1 Tax=Cutaneotrichosporon cavernicola TaxID=279322 RepID=A0AA48L1T8_9TREE|nr:uncharacterized protein CcaverHIS019_0208740 [Cutaneotrichosporon cavernicola]BEI81713.1 hypothetical protein CcaverHIS002_0208730 [Cutaneotrichosporon cavernicola]BEI89512.1 hypothetical protein CcaverHIS019_0208740 [Cutaneotrichosporon cavernicola]BEI97285.1 hypothetical protein CcaverHIS631_0208740 [Cutaneotrichosporon cavernicola]BEJ05059.1 hypothetical protein CcaverHIS641_0208760 [Cutaneotrichosporon cavernicola]